MTKAPITPRPRRPVPTGTAAGRRRARSVRAAAEEGVSLMVCVSLYAGFGQPVDLIQHGLAGGSRRRDGRLEGQRRRAAPRAAGLMATAVTPRSVSASPASLDQPGEHRRRARREERRDIEGAGFQRGACRIRAARFPRARRRARSDWTSKPSGASASARSSATRVPRRGEAGRSLGSSRWRTRSARAAPSPDADVDGAEAQALGRRGRRVADREDRLAALLARFGQRPRAVGAGQQHGLTGRKRRGEVGRRMQNLEPEQRRDDRRMAALGQRRGQRRRLAFRPGDQHAHALSVAGAHRPTQCSSDA